MKVHRHRVVARFGLMHMIGTNLSVWLNVLVQETKHEILTFYNPENNSLKISHRLGKRIYGFSRIARFDSVMWLSNFQAQRVDFISVVTLTLITENTCDSHAVSKDPITYSNAEERI